MISAVIKYSDNRVSIHTSEAKKVSKSFEKGFYTASFDQQGSLNIKEEEISELHSPYNTKDNKLIIETVKNFFNEGIREKVNALGFTHKLGVLLYGRQGTGKTSVMNYIASQMVESLNGIVFMCNEGAQLQGAISLAKSIREIQDTPIIFIADEFERYAREYESMMKNFLDGVDSIENTLFLASTNYIDKVPDTLKDRPSRFRIVQEIKGMDDKKMVEDILFDMCSKITPVLMSRKEIKAEIKEKSNFTLDELKHIVLNKVTNSYVKVKKSVIGFGKKETEEDEEPSNGLQIIWKEYYSSPKDIKSNI